MAVTSRLTHITLETCTADYDGDFAAALDVCKQSLAARQVPIDDVIQITVVRRQLVVVFKRRHYEQDIDPFTKGLIGYYD